MAACLLCKKIMTQSACGFAALLLLWFSAAGFPVSSSSIVVSCFVCYYPPVRCSSCVVPFFKSLLL